MSQFHNPMVNLDYSDLPRSLQFYAALCFQGA